MQERSCAEVPSYYGVVFNDIVASENASTSAPFSGLCFMWAWNTTLLRKGDGGRFRVRHLRAL